MAAVQAIYAEAEAASKANDQEMQKQAERQTGVQRLAEVQRQTEVQRLAEVERQGRGE